MPDQIKKTEDKDLKLADALAELDQLREENRKLRRDIEGVLDIGEGLEVLSENSSFPTAVFDGNDKLRSLNSRFTEEFGYEPADVPDRETWRRRLFPDDAYREKMLKSIRDWERKHSVGHRHHEVRIACKDGAARDLVVNVFALPRGWHYIAVQDVTSRKRSEDYIRQSEARFKASFDSAPNGMALISPERRFLAVNHQLCTMLGYRAYEMIGKSFNTFTHPEDIEGGRERYRKMLHGLETANSAEKKGICTRTAAWSGCWSVTP